MKLEKIDTSTTAGKAEVMRLASEGRKVAYLGRSPAYRDGVWNTASTPRWDWEGFDFAIIAQPVGPDEVWVPVFKDGSLYGYAHATEAGALDRVRRDGAVVRYRRVEE